MIGTAREKSAILGFVVDGIHPHDIGTVLDREGVAIRTGHHCAMPLHERYGIAASALELWTLCLARDGGLARDAERGFVHRFG